MLCGVHSFAIQGASVCHSSQVIGLVKLGISGAEGCVWVHSVHCVESGCTASLSLLSVPMSQKEILLFADKR
jgi:hypothetical protein